CAHADHEQVLSQGYLAERQFDYRAKTGALKRRFPEQALDDANGADAHDDERHGIRQQGLEAGDERQAERQLDEWIHESICRNRPRDDVVAAVAFGEAAQVHQLEEGEYEEEAAHEMAHPLHKVKAGTYPLKEQGHPGDVTEDEEDRKIGIAALFGCAIPVHTAVSLFHSVVAGIAD